MSSSGPPQLDASGTFLSTGYDWGTPTDWFDLAMALLPGLSEATRLAQLGKALAYWQAIVAANAADSDTMLRATWAVTWLSAELTRVQNPPANAIHVVYPV